jgi:hypothetical protein
MEELEIEFDAELFNPIYFELKDAMENSDIRYIWLYGGSSSSKSFSISQLTIVNMLTESDYNTLIFRKYLSDIKNSIYTDFKGIINEWGLEDLFIIQQNYIQCKETGNYVTFKGLDDPEKIKGVSGYKKIIVDEITQLDFEDYKQLKKRVRGKKNQQIVGIFNPISENHWIKTEIFDKESIVKVPSDIQEKQINELGNLVIFRTCYLDNKYIVGPYFYDKHAIQSFEDDKKNDYSYYLIYAMGEWGKLRNGGEYLKNFNPVYHTQKLQYNPELPLHLTFDENVNPYVTCTVWQLEGKHLQQIDEILLEDPRNTLAHTCNEFKKRYDGHEGGIFIYGDATSRKQDTKLEKGTNFYTLIQGYLEQFKPILRLNSINPSVVMSKLFLDAIYNNELDIQLTIDTDCKKSIYDYHYALENAEGGIDKRMVKNKLTGIKYQEFGHLLDAKKYLVTFIFKNEYQTFINGGKKRVMRVGRRATQ